MQKASRPALDHRRSTLKWFRAGRAEGPLVGFVVTWDVDSHDPALCRRLQRFIYGHSVRGHGRHYRYPGFIEREGVRYLGQSVLLVSSQLLGGLIDNLTRIGVDFDFGPAAIG